MQFLFIKILKTELRPRDNCTSPLLSFNQNLSPLITPSCLFQSRPLTPGPTLLTLARPFQVGQAPPGPKGPAPRLGGASVPLVSNSRVFTRNPNKRVTSRAHRSRWAARAPVPVGRGKGQASRSAHQGCWLRGRLVRAAAPGGEV